MPHGLPDIPQDWAPKCWGIRFPRRPDTTEADQLRRESLAEQQALQHPDPLDPEHPSPEGEE